ncbi:cytochrome P450 [Amycolatopsis minnesotensis]|uniref:Cytochrome P450 n=1 Tax=Amycolatopsis minnesotensis TaxID=337894 RepID=A0ABP5CZ83_9PSEU
MSSAPVDLASPSMIADPFAEFSRIRELGPLVDAELPGVGTVRLVTRYEDVKSVLSDTRFVVNVANVPGGEVEDLTTQSLRARNFPPEYDRYLLASILDADGADHTRLRRLVSRAFTVRRIADLRPRVAELTEQLLDRMEAAADGGEADLLAEFAYPLPITVICELVGIPEADRSHWRDWSSAMASPTGEGAGEAMREIVGYCKDLIERRRGEPADDLTSALVEAQGNDQLSEDELITFILALVLAGHETTANLIANGTFALLTHPDQFALLRENPELAPRATQELLRYCSPILGTKMRYATEDVELAGELIRKGEAVMAVPAGANHDPRRFPEPGKLDITRESDGPRETHVAFSHGIHYCLGAALARQEGEVAFAALTRRYPGLRLAVAPEDVERPDIPTVWRLTALPVRLR